VATLTFWASVKLASISLVRLSLPADADGLESRNDLKRVMDRIADALNALHQQRNFSSTNGAANGHGNNTSVSTNGHHNGEDAQPWQGSWLLGATADFKAAS
jgi:hypothetical protein